MRREIIRQFQQLAGTNVSQDGKVMTVSLPSEEPDGCGELVSVFPTDNIMVTLISINSRQIPSLVGDPVPGSQELRINYCARGRCELRLQTGECTYLTNHEIAVDAGQAANTFFFPNGKYVGLEITLYVQNDSDSTIKSLFSLCQSSRRPWIRSAGAMLDSYYESVRMYIENGISSDILLIKVNELLLLLKAIEFTESDLNRTYYSASQVEIAKRVREIICEDLSVRHSAKELGDRFGISGTSVKNYFRSVFASGFQEYQHRMRMERAAELLQSGQHSIAEIAEAVGYASQSKFGSAFREYYNMTPLEYKRWYRLGIRQQAIHV